MAQNFHLFNPGRLSRDQNTLCFEPKDGPKRFLPIADVAALYVYGALDVNSALLHFLGQKGVPVFFFGYYGNFTGSFQPKEYLQAGQVLVAQVGLYADATRRLDLARRLVEGAAANMRRTLKYYAGRARPELAAQISAIEALWPGLARAANVPELMGVEGNIRQVYYQAFDVICPTLPMSGRTRRPPENGMNALVSFGNGLCYAACLRELYHTQLDPTISFLHEPGYRRFSLALDLAEIFKPILVDRTIFSLVNKGVIKPTSFEAESGGVWLKEAARKDFVRAWEERLKETLEHKRLKRKVSYGRLLRLEGHKLAKHVLGDGVYQPFKARW